MADPPGTDGPEQVTVPDPLWDDWDAPPRVPNSPELHLPGFHGPMDLLLDLAERQRIDLGQISILQLAEQFVAEMERLQRHVAPERRADWLLVATRLLLLRSRLLFPLGPEAQAAAAQNAQREAGRLDQLVFMRAAAAWLAGRPQLGRDVFVRPHGPSPRVASYMSLMEACLFVLSGPEAQPGVEEAVYRPAPPLLFRVDEAMARIRAVLAGGHEASIDFVRCLPVVEVDDPRRELKARSAVASSFVAVLELAKCGELSASQPKAGSPILLTAVSDTAMAQSGPV